MDRSWLLLIYTVPAAPSRKRAFIWREVKKVGAVYLRDGVCALPDQAETAIAMRAIAAKVGEFDGQATLVQAAHLDLARSEWLVAQSRAARAEEYSDVSREAERLLEHVARETEHREFTFGELEQLEADLGKLKRWTAQVRGRDYFDSGPHEHLQGLLERCEQALGAFLEEAASRELATRAE